MDLVQTIPVADTWGMHGDVGAGWMITMMVVMLLFWGAIIVGIVWLIRGAVSGRSGGRRETPTEILERRFAEGAITPEDYRTRREVLAHAAEREGADRDEPLTAP